MAHNKQKKRPVRNMKPIKHQTLDQSTQRQDQAIEQSNNGNSNDENIVQNDNDHEPIEINLSQTVQISAHQAEMYLDYLREKVTHQIKDPFSLPFLNLRFQQLNSWKGVTEQLNLQSRVYGLRVDNCHDGTIKLLNQVIRNQEQQIINEKINKKQDYEQFQQERKIVQKPCFQLQNVQKLSIKQGANFEKSNNILWKAIFKKCENISAFQMNCIELSSDFSLKIDPNDQNMQFVNQEDQTKINQIFDTLPKTQNLRIFQYIQTEKTQFFQQIYDIKTRLNNKNKNKSQNEFNQYGFNNNQLDLHYDQNIMDNDMLDYFSKLEQDQCEQNIFDCNKDNRHVSIKFPNNQEFINNQMGANNHYAQHNENFINFNEILHQIHFESQSESQSSSQIRSIQLYEPYNDIIYQTTKKPLIKQKMNENLLTQKRPRQRQKQDSNINFNQFYQQKSLVFNPDQNQNNYLKQNNLLPINLVTLYQSRNPFKKIKYIKKGNALNSKYLPKMKNVYQSFNQPIFQIDNTQARFSFGSQFITPFVQFNNTSQVNFSQQIEEHLSQNESLNNNIPYSYSQKNNNFRQSKQKAVPIKYLKTQIKNQLTFFSNQKIKNSLLISQMTFDRQSEKMINFKYQTEMNILNRELGLKYLRAKMRNVDPLDIFTAMLHIAYQEQIIIRLYQRRNTSERKVCDLIMKEN